MPLGVKPVCTACKSNVSTMWRKGDKGEVLCNSCAVKQSHDDSLVEEMDTDSIRGSSSTSLALKPPPPARASISAMRIINEQSSNGLTRKSNRIPKPGRGRPSASSKALSMKGKNRRAIFKKNPIRSPASVSTVVTSDYVFYENSYYQVGDIVSLLDHSGDVYYAQLRGFMQDQFLEKSAVITWLIPTQGCEKNKFDPSKYILGPEEDLPRKLEYMEFVCHAPSDYYKSSKAPYHTQPLEPELCCVWTRIGPCIRTMPDSPDELYGPLVEEEKEKIVKSPREKDKKKDKKDKISDKKDS